MRKAIVAGIVVGAALHTFAVAAAQDNKSPESDFILTLNSIAYGCNFRADLALDAYKLSTDFGNQKAQDVAACLSEGSAKGAAAYKAEMAVSHPPAIRDDIKKVYARWRTYMDSITGTAPSDAAAERGFHDAANELKVDVENP
jgi:hypothetical protein